MDSVRGFKSNTKHTKNDRVHKKIYVKISPEKKTLSGNFTFLDRTFDISIPEKYTNMRSNIFSLGSKKSEAKVLDQMLDEFESSKMILSDNPTYEDPRDVICEKPVKPPRKRNIQSITSPRTISKDAKMLLKDQKRKLTKKYESLIVTLMERCEENIGLLTQKEQIISRLKEKLKSVLEYNNLFAQENDQLKDQHATLLHYVQDCKNSLQDLETKNKDLETRNLDLEIRVKKFDVPDREFAEHSEAVTTIPLVEVCMSCSSRQIILSQARQHNANLQRDMQALKDLLYRLNVQLAKTQEKLRSNTQLMTSDGKINVQKPNSDPFDSLITTSLGYKHEGANTEDKVNRSGRETPTHGQTGRVTDLSGLLSAQALTPLFEAYEQNQQEKDNLILDYEKQFENINMKSKQILEENNKYKEKIAILEAECLSLNNSQRKYQLEKETLSIEKETLADRVEKAESKLKEVYELYEDKMSCMMRDYETVHRSYLSAKSSLARQPRTVPADLHERQIQQCKRLLEELRHQYNMESERKAEQIAKLQQQNANLEEKIQMLNKEHDTAKSELSAALKNVRLYRKAAVIFRQRLRASTATISSLRRVSKKRRHDAPLREALLRLERIKTEIKAVKVRAYSSLEELERRIAQQERRAARAEEEHRRELDRAQTVLQHKEDIIRSLIDKVADVEEIRLSQSNAHRLQGIVSSSSDEKRQDERRDDKRRDERKLVQGHGGFYQDCNRERRKNTHT